MATASTGKGAGASAVLGGLIPRFPLGLALLRQWNKNGTWDVFTVAELAAEQLVCLLRCARRERSALPRALPQPRRVFSGYCVCLIDVLTAVWSQMWS